MFEKYFANDYFKNTGLIVFSHHQKYLEKKKNFNINNY